MRQVDLFPPGSHRVAADPNNTTPKSWIINKDEEPPEIDLDAIHAISKITKKKQKLIAAPPCTMCARSKTNTKCAPPLRPIKAAGGSKEKGVLLIVLAALADGVLWATKVLRDLGWEGLIYFDVPTRCGSNPKIDPKQVDACRPYTAFTLAMVKPTHILTCGAYASRTVLGRTVRVYQTRGAWQLVELNGKKVPVVMTCATIDASTNRFYEGFFRAEARMLINGPWDMLDFFEGTAHVVETYADCDAFDAWCEGAPYLSVDTETEGIQFQEGFKIKSLGVSKPGSNDTFVFFESLTNDAVVYRIKQRLAKHRLWGANVDYDIRAFWCAWGIDLSLHVDMDVRLAYLCLHPGFPADLSEMVLTVGFGQHKAEAEAALREAMAEVREEWEGDGDEHDWKRIKAWIYARLKSPVMERYVGRDALGARALGEHLVWLMKKRPALWDYFQNYVMPASRRFFRIERRGMLIDRERLIMVTVYLEAQVEKYTKVLTAPPPEGPGINPDKPDTIRAFFEREGLKAKRLTPQAKLEADLRGYVLPTDKRSTDKRALEALRSQHTVIADIIEWRKVAKLLSANVRTIIKYIGHDGFIHPSFLLGAAASYRASVKDPAAHSTPGRTDEGKAFKSCFVAPPDHEYLVADYVTLEVFGAAFKSGDKKMMEILQSGKDFHLETTKGIALYAWGMTPDQIEEEYLAVKAANKANGTNHKYKKREQGKTVGLATMYRIGPESLSEQAGCTVAEAKKMIAAYALLYPDYAAYVTNNDCFVAEHGYSQGTFLGTPTIARELPGAAFKDRQRYSAAYRAGSNHPIQYECSAYCQASGTLIEEMLEAQGIDHLAGIVMEVHDSLVLVVHKDVFVHVARLVVEVMTSWQAGPFPFRVSLERGPSWGEAKEWTLPSPTT